MPDTGPGAFGPMEASVPAAHRETLASETPTVLAPLPSDDRLIPAAELPRFIGLAVQTLARLRCEGNGPPFVEIGRLIYTAPPMRGIGWPSGDIITLYIRRNLQHYQQLRCPK